MGGRFLIRFGLFVMWLACFRALAADGKPDATIVRVQRKVDFLRLDANQLRIRTPATEGFPLIVSDQVQTGEDGEASIAVRGGHRIELGAMSLAEIRVPEKQFSPWLTLKSGVLYFFSREKAAGMQVGTPHATGAHEGTEFLMIVEEDQNRTLMAVFDGSATLKNEFGEINLRSGELGIARLGQRPEKASLEAVNIVQWWLYYPGVLDIEELELTPVEKSDLAESLDSYRSGDLSAALTKYPGYPSHQAPTNDAKRIYLAALYLAVGQVGKAEALLDKVASPSSLTAALRWVIAAVQRKVDREPQVNTSASEWLGLSYYYQARHELDKALLAAANAVDRSPNFGFGWVRVAELEFGYGRIQTATRALEVGLNSGSRNAQAHALKGFLLSAQNRIIAAQAAFDEAIAIDSSLGNAWLGRGLVRIRRGDTSGGEFDLQTAAILEPNRSLLRSYLGKAFSDAGEHDKALLEFTRAKELDAKDPTPWLYSALLNRQENRVNEGIRDLDESVDRNRNRRVYRSELLLDQDRAVQSANLAQLYQDDGMPQVAVREATRAVESDYGNAPAHLFLANSYDALRDPTRIELRYETPWFHELLLANLLSPVGGGRLSQFVSQHEYSKLFETDGLGASIRNEWRSDSKLLSAASVFGTYRKTSFGLDVFNYDSEGDRPNSDDKRVEVYGQFKHEVTPNDILYFLGKWQEQESGDTFKTYDNRPLSRRLRFEETQAPGLLLAGWNHRWGPGANTLFLGGRLSAEQTLSNPQAAQLLLERDAAALRPGFIQNVGGFDQFTDPALRNAIPPAVQVGPDGQTLIFSPALLQAIAPFVGAGNVTGESTAPFDFYTQRRIEIYSAELQHIQQLDWNTVILGGRLQTGEFETDARLDVIRPTFAGGFATPTAKQHSNVDFNRVNLYAYDFWNVATWLTLIGGVSWDRVEHPDNFRNPPISDEQRQKEQLSGKVGFTLSPSQWFRVRAVYAEALGGVTFDESATLEPVQLAGFNQAYRTVLSESIAGSVEVPEFKIAGLTVEGALPSDTWWAASVNFIKQDVDRTVGAFAGYDIPDIFPINPAYFPDTTKERLAYREQSFESTINQLLGKEFAVGARYLVTKSHLRDTLPEIPITLAPRADLEDEAILHELSLHCNWNSPIGFFARGEANWYSQHLKDDPDRLARKGDEFWQINAMVGFRFNRNRAEISVGMLNINDANYRLSPLNPYGSIPRERTITVRCRFTF